MTPGDLIAEAIGSLIPGMNDYRKTEHGTNEWSVEGLTNVLKYKTYMDHAVRLVGRGRNSVFRNERVNKAAGGVPDSYHLKGLAQDIELRAGLSVDGAADLLFAAAKRNELGPVHKIIREYKNGIVHIDWHPPGKWAPPQLVEDARY